MKRAGYFRTVLAAALGRLSIKASVVGPLISRVVTGRPVWPQRDFEKLGKEGYQQNPVVYACVKLIASAVGDIPWCMYEGKGEKQKEVEEHDFLELMDHPNVMQDRRAFLESVISYYLITGNSFLERSSDPDTGVVETKWGRIELYSHRPDRIKVVPGPTGIPAGYEYQMAERRRWKVDPDKGNLPILHLKTFNPAGDGADWYGQSPLDACAWAIDLHNGASSHNLALLNNSGAPSGALLHEGTEDGGHILSPEKAEEILAELRGERRGYDRSGSRMLLEGKFAWIPMGLDMEKLQTIESKNTAAREIAFTLGVPPMLLGIPGDNTYSNYQEARQAFYQDTVIPMARWLVGQFNHWFRDSLGKGVYLEVNTDDLDALSLVRKEQWDRMDKTQMLTLNEKREAIGYEPVDGGEEMYGEVGRIPLSMASKEFMGGEGDISDMLVDDPEAKKPKGSAKHMPRASVHYLER